MKFSVVIPSFNDYRILRTLDSIIKQDYKSDKIEIIVVDNNSKKNTRCYKKKIKKKGSNYS